MNNIKFRVWAIDSSKLTRPRLETRLCVINQKSQLYIYNARTGQYFEPGNENYVIQQFTGLKDSVGEDIYEGDIVECEFTVQSGTHIGVIEYCEKYGFFGIKLNGVRAPEIPKPFMNFTTNNSNLLVKIIGNVQQNPESLKS